MGANETPPTGRELRALEIAKSGKIKKLGGGTKYAVPSQSAKGNKNAPGAAGYLVDPTAERCTCPDHDLRKMKCKHLIAVSLVIQWEQDGVVSSATIKIARPTYPQPDWSKYHRAQVEEKDRVEMMLSALCDGIIEPAYVFGRRGHLLRDLIFAAVHKVYTNMSGRRAQTDLRRCAERGYLTRVPCYNTVFQTLESPYIADYLKGMIDESASVLSEFESCFAPDSTGFTTVTYARYYDLKYGSGRKKQSHAAKDEPATEPVMQHDVVKLHAMVGTRTNVVTHAEVTSAGDAPTMKALLEATAKNFTIKEVVADKGYLSKDNVALIHSVGARPLIPFKENSSGKGPLLWRQMYCDFMLRRPEFLSRFHARSNVEATFSAIKRVFGGAVRSKLPVAQASEVYAKTLCHNLRCVVEATFMLDLEIPPFWSKDAA